MTDTAATTKPEMAGTEWMLPDLTRVPKDQLELRMDVYEDSIILTRFNEAGHTQWVRMVSADDIAGAFAGEIDYSSGLLPKDTLWWKQTETTRTVALWREPGVWPVALQTEAFKPPERLNLPMPGLVFVCVPGAPPWAFAAKQRPSTAQETLYRMPAFNVFDDGRVCPGTHRFPQEPGSVPESFFQSFFSQTGQTQNRSVKHPLDLRALWQELNGETQYPLEDLIPQFQVEDAIDLPRRLTHRRHP